MDNSAFSTANSVLIFTNIGYADKEAPVGTGSVNIMLEQSQRSLQEVVVTGYTTQIKSRLPGPFQSYQEKRSNYNLWVHLIKRYRERSPPAIPITSGQPGDAAVVTIRGKGSITEQIHHVYIIDGVQVNAGDFSTINPGDIESFNVLKDASSTAIYGSRVQMA
jgi:hypothetical protein